MADKNIHKNHRRREKEKYAKSGADAFLTHQLLELLLYGKLLRVNTNPIAHDLLEAFPGVKLIGAAPEELETVWGVGEKTSFSLKVSFDTTLRIICDGMENKTLDSEFKRSTYVYLRCLGKCEESVIVWYLTEKMRVAGETEFTGKMNHPENFAEKILSSAKNAGAKYIMICHSHGENGTTPSVEDIYVTEYIKKYLSQTGTELLEHYIVSETDCAKCRIPEKKDEK